MDYVSVVRELVRSVVEQDDKLPTPDHTEDPAYGQGEVRESHVNWAAKHIRDHCPLMEKGVAARHFGHFFHAHVKNFDHKKFKRMAGLREAGGGEDDEGPYTDHTSDDSMSNPKQSRGIGPDVFPGQEDEK
jgi:hypothetical protein